MRALVKSAPGWGLELREVPDPVASKGEVLLRVGAAGVCGSDVARFVWTSTYGSTGAKAMDGLLPRILGHEFAGTVVESKDRRFRDGDRVVVRNILSCGVCSECVVGRPNVCAERRTIGVHRDGGYAELAAVPAANCRPIPDDMSMHLAAAIQPFAVATHAVRQAELEPGDRVVVWGLGPIGLAVTFAARARGAVVAIAFDVNEERVTFARKLGIDVTHVAAGVEGSRVVVERCGPRSVDAFFDAAGAIEDVLAGIGALRKRRPVVLIGNLHEPHTLDLMSVIMDEQRLIGSRSYSLRSWDQASATIIRSGFEATLGDEVPLEGAIDRFEAAAAGRGRPFTIMPNGPECGSSARDDQRNGR